MERYLPVEVEPRDDLISRYFKLGFNYQEILLFLHDHHDIHMGLRQLNRLLRKLGLHRKLPRINMAQFLEAIQHELANTGFNLGYRTMQNRLRNVHDIYIDRESVRVGLAYLDPAGVAKGRTRRLLRRRYWSKCPNYLIRSVRTWMYWWIR